MQSSIDGINFSDVPGGLLEVTNDATGKTICIDFDGTKDLFFRLISKSSGWNIYDFIVKPDNMTTGVPETEVTDITNIHLTGNILYLPENKSVTIYNISGKLCFQNKNTTTIDFSAQNRGYYIVRIKDMKGNTIISKIMY